jgi:hypothetical protein
MAKEWNGEGKKDPEPSTADAGWMPCFIVIGRLEGAKTAPIVRFMKAKAVQKTQEQPRGWMRVPYAVHMLVSLIEDWPACACPRARRSLISASRKRPAACPSRQLDHKRSQCVYLNSVKRWARVPPALAPTLQCARPRTDALFS